MMKQDDYTYATGDLLIDRNRYSYTPFVGTPFLDGWHASRQSIMEKCPDPSPAPAPRASGSLAELIGQTEIQTADLMERVFAQLVTQDFTDDLNMFLWKLMDRFENVKRFHSAYNERFRACDKDAFTDYELYVRGGEIFLKSYELTQELSYLNVFLKIMDTLCALHHVWDDGQLARLAQLIVSERDCVERVSQDFESKQCLVD